MTEWQLDRKYIAQGCLTNSKHPDRFVGGIYPTHAKSADGCTIIGNDNIAYIDFICGLGTNLFGYNNVLINQAVMSAMGQGFSHSLPTRHAAEACEKLCELFPFVDKWKFLKTGSEACSAAVRIARSNTQRRVILSDGYHGWHDQFVSLTPPASGVGATSAMRKYDVYSQINADVAAVIIEPDRFTFDYLKMLRDACIAQGSLLIYDEVITGLRYKSYSVSEASKIRPDLIILGKAIAGGLPLAAVGGPPDLMDGDYFVSSTYAGEILSLAVCRKICEMIQTNYKVDELWKTGGEFVQRFNELTKLVQIEGYNTRGAFKFVDDTYKALFFQESCKAGILFGPSWFWSFAHIGITDQVISVCDSIIRKLATGKVKIEGRLPTSPFAAKVRS
jgi:aminotransferase MxcL